MVSTPLNVIIHQQACECKSRAFSYGTTIAATANARPPLAAHVSFVYNASDLRTLQGGYT
jgi:hypothetical protein